jgi:hypothetical protein
VTFVSVGPIFHSVQARDAAFFSLPFPANAQPVHRILDKCGVVDLSSGAGHFWMRAHLFVADHPYFTTTDDKGQFILDRVPPGDYEAVCWHPNWHEAEHELDADTGLVCRLTYKAPAEVRWHVHLAPRASQEVVFTLSGLLFGR